MDNIIHSENAIRIANYVKLIVEHIGKCMSETNPTTFIKHRFFQIPEYSGQNAVDINNLYEHLTSDEKKLAEQWLIIFLEEYGWSFEDGDPGSYLLTPLKTD